MALSICEPGASARGLAGGPPVREGPRGKVGEGALSSQDPMLAIWVCVLQELPRGHTLTTGGMLGPSKQSPGLLGASLGSAHPSVAIWSPLGGERGHPAGGGGPLALPGDNLTLLRLSARPLRPPR